MNANDIPFATILDVLHRSANMEDAAKTLTVRTEDLEDRLKLYQKKISPHEERALSFAEWQVNPIEKSSYFEQKKEVHSDAVSQMPLLTATPAIPLSLAEITHLHVIITDSINRDDASEKLGIGSYKTLQRRLAAYAVDGKKLTYKLFKKLPPERLVDIVQLHVPMKNDTDSTPLGTTKRKKIFHPKGADKGAASIEGKFLPLPDDGLSDTGLAITLKIKSDLISPIPSQPIAPGGSPSSLTQQGFFAKKVGEDFSRKAAAISSVLPEIARLHDIITKSKNRGDASEKLKINYKTLLRRLGEYAIDGKKLTYKLFKKLPKERLIDLVELGVSKKRDRDSTPLSNTLRKKVFHPRAASHGALGMGGVFLPLSDDEMSHADLANTLELEDDLTFLIHSPTQPTEPYGSGPGRANSLPPIDDFLTQQNVIAEKRGAGYLDGTRPTFEAASNEAYIDRLLADLGHEL